LYGRDVDGSGAVPEPFHLGPTNATARNDAINRLCAALNSVEMALCRSARRRMLTHLVEFFGN